VGGQTIRAFVFVEHQVPREDRHKYQHRQQDLLDLESSQPNAELAEDAGSDSDKRKKSVEAESCRRSDR
jgi:hypothetical protein